MIWKVLFIQVRASLMQKAMRAWKVSWFGVCHYVCLHMINASEMKVEKKWQRLSDTRSFIFKLLSGTKMRQRLFRNDGNIFHFLWHFYAIIIWLGQQPNRYADMDQMLGIYLWNCLQHIFECVEWKTFHFAFQSRSKMKSLRYELFDAQCSASSEVLWTFLDFLILWIRY